MKLDPAHAPIRDTYALLAGLVTPRPIAWVTTVSPHGITNLAPFSFFNGVAANPPTLVFSAVNNRNGTRKDTVVNLESTPEFVVNVVSYDNRVAMNESSAELPYETSEIESFGITTVASERVRPPRIAQSHAHFECVVHQIVRVGEGPLAANLVIGRIVLVHVADAVLGAGGRVDPQRLDAIGRLGGDEYTRTTERFSLERPATASPAIPPRPEPVG